MAALCGLKVAKHGLIKLKTNDLAYVTRRFDRPKKGKKVAVEDFCQLSELLTENKYNSSIEKAGKIILRYASNSGLDLVSYYELILFSYLTGNSDMHLKNFSLMRNNSNDIILAPFYDLLATRLLLPEDKEETALTINGKRNKLKKDDFVASAKSLKIGDKVITKCFERILKHVPKMKVLIQKSFLSKDLKQAYSKLIDTRAKALS
jgi:serine/threonine-protein kinase HipA